MFEKKIVVIGGSIAGCTIAILLQRLGFQVEVLERSKGLTDRGAGILMPGKLIQECIELDLFDSTIPHFAVLSRSFATQDTKQFWHQALKAEALSWQDVYQNLCKRIDSMNYHNNTTVVHIENIEDVYHIRLFPI